MSSTKFIFTLFAFLCSSALYGQVYDDGVVQRFEIYFAEDNWDHILDSLKINDEGYLVTDSVVINGTVMDSVGAKYKGNSSFNPEGKKNSFTLDLDKFKEHEFEGLKKYKLHNLYQDPSLIREPLAYKILREYTVAPRASFAEVYVNGVYHGLYSNTEDGSKHLMSARFGSDKDNTMFKCSPIVTPGPTVKSNLRYISADSSDYENFYELESDEGWGEIVGICDVVTNNPSKMDSVLNLNAMMWMLAFNQVTVNLDSYLGAFAQNYILYREDNGQYTPVGWDMNMSFGGFPFIGSRNTSLGALSIEQLKTLPTDVHATDSYWPVIVAIQDNPTWKRMYQAHLRTMVKEQLTSGAYATLATEMHDLVSSAVLRDTNKSFTNEEFTNSFTTDVNIGAYDVPGLTTLMSDRTTYLEGTPELTAMPPTIGTPMVGPAIIEQQVVLTVAITGNNIENVLCYVRRDTLSRYQRVELLDDGMHGDGDANDGVYGAQFDAAVGESQYYLYAENTEAGIFSPARAGRQYHTVEITTSVEEEDLTQTLAPYPNPASDMIVVPMAAIGGSVVDVRGAVVLETITEPSIDLSNLQPGIYRVVQGAQSWSFVVVR